MIQPSLQALQARESLRMGYQQEQRIVPNCHSSIGTRQADKTTNQTISVPNSLTEWRWITVDFASICSLCIIFSFSIMKQILQAKVNLLIEKNRLEMEEKEKEKKVQSKLQSKISFSHYEEPSKNVKFLTRGGRIQQGEQKFNAKTMNKQQEQAQKEHHFQKRFHQVEREKNKQISLEELQKQQYYLQQILNNLNLKVNRATLKMVQHNLNNPKTLKKNKTNPFIRKISRNLTENYPQTPIAHSYSKQNNNQQSFIHQNPNNTYFQTLNHQSDLNQSRMSQLSVQYTHLQNELLKYIRKGNNQDSDSLDIQTSQLSMNNQIHELEGKIRNLRKSIKELKKQVNENVDKNVRKDDCEVDKGDELKIQGEYKYLRFEIYKRSLANEEKKLHLKDLLEQKEKTTLTLSDLQKTKLLFEQQIVTKHYQDNVSFPANLSANESSFSKLKHKTTLSVNNSSTPQYLQHQYQYLLKKKQIVQKSKQSQLSKWKLIYKQKMKKLVYEYSHISHINDLALNLETNKHMKEEEIEEYQTNKKLGRSSLL